MIKKQIERYRAGIDLLYASLDSVKPEDYHRVLVKGKMTIAQLICHISDFEPILSLRIKRLLTAEKPLLMGYNENDFLKLHAEGRDLSIELEVYRSTRQQLLSILERTPEEDFKNQGVHSEIGKGSAFQFLCMANGHTEHHLCYMNDKREALGLQAISVTKPEDYPPVWV